MREGGFCRQDFILAGSQKGVRGTPLALAAFILLIAALHAGAAQGSTRQRLAAMVPEPYEGYATDGGPMFCVGMVNLTFIHNGGYMDYVDRGVEEALTQTYTRDTSYYTATLYTMNSGANASAILEHFRSLYSAEANTLGDGGFEHSLYGMNYVYFHLEDLFVTLEGTGGSSMEAMRQSAQEIVTKAVPEALLQVVIVGMMVVLAKHAGRRPAHEEEATSRCRVPRD